MNVIETARERLLRAAQTEHGAYAGDEDRPLGGYLATMTTYAGVVGAIAALARATRRDVPDGLPVKDIALSALASYRLSRLLAKDPVTSPLRAPFTSYAGTSGPAELHEEVRGSGVRKTVGELVTCPFCSGLWVATGFTAGLMFLPKPTRLAMGTLSALAVADLMQFAHAWLQQQSS